MAQWFKEPKGIVDKVMVREMAIQQLRRMQF